MVECYFWILGVCFEADCFLSRRILTKVIVMTSLIDDIYDVYGTLEELELFTQAIERLKSTHFLISAFFWLNSQKLLPFLYSSMVTLIGKVNS
jgi:hypothetical protein